MQTPLGTFVVAELLIPARSGHLVGLELDIAHGGNFLNKTGGTSLEKRGVKPLLWSWLVSMKVGRL